MWRPLVILCCVCSDLYSLSTVRDGKTKFRAVGRGRFCWVLLGSQDSNSIIEHLLC